MLRDINENSVLDLAKWDVAIKLTATLTGFFFLLRSCEYLRTEHATDPEKFIKWSTLCSNETAL